VEVGAEVSEVCGHSEGDSCVDGSCGWGSEPGTN